MSVAKDVSMETISKLPDNVTIKDIKHEIDLLGHIFEELKPNEEAVDENIIKRIEQCVEQSEYDKYIIIPLEDIFIKNDRVKLSKTMHLIVQFENGQFIVSYNDLGWLATNNSLDFAIEEIQMEFSGLWDDYVTSPEEELSRSGIAFKNKLMEYVGHN